MQSETYANLARLLEDTFLNYMVRPLLSFLNIHSFSICHVARALARDFLGHNPNN